MATAEDDLLQNFSQFVRQRLKTNDPSEVQLGELMDEWQLLHPSDAQSTENVDAVNAAIDDFKYGDRGRLTQELRRERPKPANQPQRPSTALAGGSFTLAWTPGDQRRRSVGSGPLRSPPSGSKRKTLAGKRRASCNSPAEQY